MSTPTIGLRCVTCADVIIGAMTVLRSLDQMESETKTDTDGEPILGSLRREMILVHRHYDSLQAAVKTRHDDTEKVVGAAVALAAVALKLASNATAARIRTRQLELEVDMCTLVGTADT